MQTCLMSIFCETKNTICVERSLLFSFFSRVDADCMSPDVKNSIHVGDKILEINGTPIHNVPLDEVFTTVNLHSPVFVEGKTSTSSPELTVCLQIDLLIQETSRLLQLTIEHDPHAQKIGGSSSEAEDQLDSTLFTPVSEGPIPTLPVTQPPNPDICNLKSRIIT